VPIYRGNGGSGDSSTDAYASQVAGYATTATSKASEASISAGLANDAKLAAEAAEAGVEEDRIAAEAAAGNASGFASDAEQAKLDAEGFAGEAEQAKIDAQAIADGLGVAADITATDVTNWDTAFSWGNHASAGYITGYTVTESDVTTHQAALSITESQISDLGSYATLSGATFTGTVTATRGYGATQTANATGSTTLDFSTYQNFVLTLTGNVTLDNPTTEAVGQSGFIVFIQDGTGSRTVSLGTDYETAGAAGLTLSTAASTTDIVPYIVAASGRILLGAPQLGFA